MRFDLKGYQYLLGKVSTWLTASLVSGCIAYQYLLGKVSTKKIKNFCRKNEGGAYQYLLGKVSTTS